MRRIRNHNAGLLKLLSTSVVFSSFCPASGGLKARNRKKETETCQHRGRRFLGIVAATQSPATCLVSSHHTVVFSLPFPFLFLFPSSVALSSLLIFARPFLHCKASLAEPQTNGQHSLRDAFHDDARRVRTGRQFTSTSRHERPVDGPGHRRWAHNIFAGALGAMPSPQARPDLAKNGWW